MFDRIALHSSATLIGITAFAVAASIFVTFSWRAIRMKGTQLDKLANLPFEEALPSTRHGPNDAPLARP